MTYSIIIPTCNRKHDLQLTLDSIRSQTILPAEIYIIDQSDSRDTEKFVLDIIDDFDKAGIKIFYQFFKEKSSAVARNVGISMANGEILSFLDDDVVLFKDYFEKVIQYFRNHEDIGGISGNVVIDNFKIGGLRQRVRELISRMFLFNNFNGRMTISGFGYPIFEGFLDDFREVEIFSGCNMNFRKECLRGKKFDPWFIGYSFREDVEFSYRVSRGTRMMMIPDAKLYHSNSVANRMKTGRRKRMEFLNYYYVYKKLKHKNSFSLILFVYSLFGIGIMDLIEFLWSFKVSRLVTFFADLEEFFRLLWLIVSGRMRVLSNKQSY